MSAKRMIRQALCRVKASSPFVRTFSAAIELREYNLKPSRAGEFQKLANASGALRNQHAPLRLLTSQGFPLLLSPEPAKCAPSTVCEHVYRNKRISNVRSRQPKREILSKRRLEASTAFIMERD
jgi:hypothetical protein